MIRKFAICFFAVLTLPLSSYALVGGPFDNGDYSQSLDDRGIYQAALRCKNGVGFAQFGSGVSNSLYVSATSSATAGSTRSTAFTTLNRSVMYYKGVSYLGSATGMTDFEQRTVTTVCNLNSDVGTTGSINPSTTGNTSTVTAATTSLINNGARGLVMNIGYTAHISTLQPILKFNGVGELSVLNADGAQLVNTAVQGLIAAIPAAAATSSVTGLITAIGQVTDPALIAKLQTATVSNESTFKLADRQQLYVRGQRKFFLSQQ